MSLHMREVAGTNSEAAGADTSCSELRLGPVFSPSLGRAKAWVNEYAGWKEEVHPAGTTALRRTSPTPAGARAAGTRGAGRGRRVPGKSYPWGSSWLSPPGTAPCRRPPKPRGHLGPPDAVMLPNHSETGRTF